MSELPPATPGARAELEPRPDERAELERRQDERQERRRLIRQAALALLVAAVLVARILYVHG